MTRNQLVRRGAVGAVGATAGAIAGMAGRALLKRGAQQLARGAAKRMYAGKKKSNSGGGNPGLGVSKYHESKRMYKAKRFRGKKRSLHKFKKRVQAVIDGVQASQIELMRDHIDSTAAINTQQIVSASVYGEAGVSGSSFDAGAQDLTQLIVNSFNFTGGKSTKIDIQSAHLDLYITNTGLVPATTACYVDIYKYVCRRDTYQYDGVGGFYNATFSDAQTLVSASALTPTTFGVTPFMNTNWCNHFKILSVDRVLLGPGETVNVQMSDKRKRTYFYLASNKVVCKKGWTKGFFIIFKGSAGYNQQDTPSTLSIEALRTYKYVVPSSDVVNAGRVDV